MPAKATVHVTGIKEALRDLNSIDKRLRREVTAEYRQIVRPMVNEASNLIPNTPPMSGWARSWNPTNAAGTRSTQPILPWGRNGQYRNSEKAKPYVSSKRPTEFRGIVRNLAAFGMFWAAKDAVLFDMSSDAKTPQGARMVTVLNNRFGQTSRAMWAAYERTDTAVQRELRNLVEKVMRAVGRDISVKP